MTWTLVVLALLAELPQGESAANPQRGASRQSAPSNQGQDTGQDLPWRKPRGIGKAETQGPGTDAPGPRPATQAELLVAALVASDSGGLTGQPATLAELLAPLADRGRQIDVTHAYWDLATAIAHYNIALEEASRLEQFQTDGQTAAPAAEQAILAAELAAVEARLNEAEMDIVSAQQALVQTAGVAGAPLVPADVPHAAAYRTYFQDIYSGKAAPPRAHLIDRTLPLLLRSLEARAACVQAAADAADAAHEAWRQGDLPMAQAIDSANRLRSQRQAFMATARLYNRDIAEYALSVAPPGLATPELVSMLIKPAHGEPPGGPSQADSVPGQADSGPGQADSGPGQADEVQRAGFDEPLPYRGSQARGTGNRPTPAAPRIEDLDGDEPAGQNGDQPSRLEFPSAIEEGDPDAPEGESQHDQSPDDQPADADAGESNDSAPDDGGSGGAQRNGAERGEAELEQLDQSDAALSPADPESLSSARRRKSLRAGAGGDSPQQPVGLYDALRELSPAQRARHLAELLHWNRTLPDPSAATIELAECLAWNGGALDRHAVIESYWTARHNAAAYQLAVQRVEQLNALTASTLERRSQTLGPEIMLDLRRAQLDSRADLAEAHFNLAASQFELLVSGRRPLEAAWPVPGTVPHAGSYRLKLEAQPEWIAQAPQVQAAARAVPAQAEIVLQRAAAVVAADTARAQFTAQYESGSERSLAEVIDTIDRQAEESLAFVAAQTRYNLRIADYALAVLPGDAPRATLLRALVVRDTPAGVGGT